MVLFVESRVECVTYKREQSDDENTNPAQEKKSCQHELIVIASVNVEELPQRKATAALVDHGCMLLFVKELRNQGKKKRNGLQHVARFYIIIQRSVP